jgi:hypothetical protein
VTIRPCFKFGCTALWRIVLSLYLLSDFIGLAEYDVQEHINFHEELQG